MAASERTSAEEDAPVRRGRKRDASRDGEILDAALAVLAEVGYDGMTMDAVAARAKAGKATVYRRWASKPELVRDAVAHLRSPAVSLDGLPDTGTLRGDLLAFNTRANAEEEERKLNIIAGLSSQMQHDPTLLETVSAALMEPWIDLNRLLLRRAIDRGEIPAHTDVELLSRVVPHMASYRALVLHEPVDLDDMIALIDGVLLPAIRGADPP